MFRRGGPGLSGAVRDRPVKMCLCLRAFAGCTSGTGVRDRPFQPRREWCFVLGVGLG